MNDDSTSEAGHLTGASATSAEPTARQRLLLAYLEEHYEACPSCQYELHGLRGHHCPECGQSLTLRVGLEHPNLAAYLTGLIALSATAGFGGLFALLFLVFSMASRGARGEAGVIAVFVGITIVCGGLIFAWVRNGGRIRRADPAVRRLLAAACCLTPLLAILAVYVILGPP